MKITEPDVLSPLCLSPMLIPCMEELSSILIQCRKEKNHDLAIHLHSKVCNYGLEAHKLMGNYLVSMLAVTGHIHDAHRVSKTLTYLDQWSWYSLIAGYINFEKPEIALILYDTMDSYICPSGHTFVALLKACTKLNDLERGIAIHLEMARTGLLEDNPFVGSALVGMYTKCGSLTSAQQVFDAISIKDVVSWTAIIAGFVERGHGEEALMYYEWMQKEGVFPNATTFLSSLKACGCIRAIAKGREIHSEMVKRGLLEGDDILGSMLVDMYAKCGALATAEHMFDKLQSRDVIAWTAMFAGYADHGQGKEALECYEEMQGHGVAPNVATLVCVLKACGTLRALEEGQETHMLVEKLGLFGRDPVVGYALVDMYTKCGSLVVGRLLFDDLPLRSVVPWTSIIGGYVEHRCAEVSLNLLELMHMEGVVPNAITHLCALKACSQLKDVSKGQEIHAEVERHGLPQEDIGVGNSLIDFYAKCGLLDKAHEVCVRVPARSIVSWNALIMGYVEWGHGEEAMNCFEQMESQGVYPDQVTFLCMLKACGTIGAVDKGKEIHATVERLGPIERDHLIHRAVVDFYAKCGLLATASHVFGMLSVRDLFAWTALIAGHTEFGDYEAALELSEQMQFKGVTPTPTVFACILRCCGNLGHAHKGLEIHSEVERLRLLKSDIDVGNMLVFMYAKCGSLVKAREVFERLPVRTIVTWKELLVGYADHGYGKEAIECFEQMQSGGISPDMATLMAILKACEHEWAHTDSPYVETEVERDGFAQSTLVSMYLTCGVPPVAQYVFDKLPIQDIYAWNALISCYSKHGQAETALTCYELMQLRGISPDAGTLLHTLSACGGVSMADQSREVWADIGRLSLLHAEIERAGWLERDQLLGCTLIQIYAKCGRLWLAQEVFDELPVQDVVAWDALIAGYAGMDHDEEALRCISEMQAEGFSPSPFTFLHGLQACASHGAIIKAQEIHAETQRQGMLEGNLFLGNKLVDLYAKCGLFTQAREVFDMLPSRNVVSWNTLISGYSGNGHDKEVVELLGHMQREGVSPDPITWLCTLKACANFGAIPNVQKVHDGIQRRSAANVGSTLVNMYVNGGSLAKAQRIFVELPLLARNVIAWNVLVTAYANLGLGDEAVNCLEQMQLEGVTPSAVTYVSMLMACASIGAAEKGREVHAEIERRGLLDDTLIMGNTLVNMYAKCGFLTVAKQVCDSLPARDVVSWTTMMAGYAQAREGHHAISCFGRMLEGGIRPDVAVFVVLLSACNCSLFAKGHTFVEAMEQHTSLVHSLRHQTCLAVLLCRAGHVYGLSSMVMEQLLPPSSMAWHGMLRACRNWGSLELGQEAFKRTIHVDEEVAITSDYSYEDAEAWIAGTNM